MQKDYKKHPYARTLRFFEAYYPYDTEKVNYAEISEDENEHGWKDIDSSTDNFKDVPREDDEVVETDPKQNKETE